MNKSKIIKHASHRQHRIVISDIVIRLATINVANQLVMSICIIVQLGARGPL